MTDNEEKSAEIINLPLASLAYSIRNYYTSAMRSVEVINRAKAQWITDSIALGTALRQARLEFESNSEFSQWLKENGPEALGQNDRAALINMATDPGLMRTILTVTRRTSWQTIWEKEAKEKYPEDMRLPNVRKTTNRPKETAKSPPEPPPTKFERGAAVGAAWAAQAATSQPQQSPPSPQPTPQPQSPPAQPIRPTIIVNNTPPQQPDPQPDPIPQPSIQRPETDGERRLRESRERLAAIPPAKFVNRSLASSGRHVNTMTEEEERRQKAINNADDWTVWLKCVDTIPEGDNEIDFEAWIGAGSNEKRRERLFKRWQEFYMIYTRLGRAMAKLTSEDIKSNNYPP